MLNQDLGPDSEDARHEIEYKELVTRNTICRILARWKSIH